MQVVVAQGLFALNFSTPSLSVAVLKHHALEMILRLGIAVAEKSGRLGFANDVRHARFVTINGDLFAERVLERGRQTPSQSSQQGREQQNLSDARHGPSYSCIKQVVPCISGVL